MTIESNETGCHKGVVRLIPHRKSQLVTTIQLIYTLINGNMNVVELSSTSHQRKHHQQHTNGQLQLQLQPY